jgi:hypothetical protein
LAAAWLSSCVFATISSRACSADWIGGTTNFQITASTTRKMRSSTKRVPLGTRKLSFFFSASARMAMEVPVMGS